MSKFSLFSLFSNNHQRDSETKKHVIFDSQPGESQPEILPTRVYSASLPNDSSSFKNLSTTLSGPIQNHYIADSSSPQYPAYNTRIRVPMSPIYEMASPFQDRLEILSEKKGESGRLPEEQSESSESESTSEYDDELDDEIEGVDLRTTPLEPPVSPKFPKGRASESNLNPFFSPGSWLKAGFILLCSVLLFHIWDKQFYERRPRVPQLTAQLEPIALSTIPRLYKDLVNDISSQEGNPFLGKLVTFPGDPIEVNQRFVNEMPELIYTNKPSDTLQELAEISARMGSQYTTFYRDIHRHIEDTIALTSAVLEDLISIARVNSSNFAYESPEVLELLPGRSYNFEKETASYPFQCRIFSCPSTSELIRAMYIKYMKGLEKGYGLPTDETGYWSCQTLGYVDLRRQVPDIKSSIKQAKDDSQSLRAIAKLAVVAATSNEYTKRPGFVSRSKSQSAGDHSDTIGYIKHWLETDFANGEKVREEIIPRLFDQYYNYIVNIETYINQILYNDFWKLDEEYSIGCHIQAWNDALKDLIDDYRYVTMLFNRNGFPLPSERVGSKANLFRPQDLTVENNWFVCVSSETRLDEEFDEYEQ